MSGKYGVLITRSGETCSEAPAVGVGDQSGLLHYPAAMC